MKKIIITFISFVLVVSPLSAGKTVEEILAEFDKTISVPSLQGTFTVKLISKNGDTREIKARAYQKLVDNKQNNRLFIFDFPPRVRGTGLLVHSFLDGRDNNMWIYLPTVKRVKRIALESSGGGYFMGSDFTYRDLIANDLNNMKFELLEEKTMNGTESYVIKCWGKNQEVIKDLGYSYMISYYKKENSVMYRREFFDSDSKLLKIYQVDDFHVSGKYHYPTKITMTNVQTEHKSIIEVTEISTKDIPERYFTTRYLTDK